MARSSAPGSGEVVALRRDGEHARAQGLVLLGSERVHRAEPGDPALEANDLALGALCRRGVELDRVVVSEVADGAGKLRDRRLARDDLRLRRPGARRRRGQPRPRPRHARSRARGPRTRAPGWAARRGRGPAVPRRAGRPRARLAATLEAMHDRGECIALGDEPPGLRCGEPGPGCLECAARGFATLFDMRAFGLCTRDEQLGLLGGEPGALGGAANLSGRVRLRRRQLPRARRGVRSRPRTADPPSVVGLDSRGRFGPADDEGRRGALRLRRCRSRAPAGRRRQAPPLQPPLPAQLDRPRRQRTAPDRGR